MRLFARTDEIDEAPPGDLEQTALVKGMLWSIISFASCFSLLETLYCRAHYKTGAIRRTQIIQLNRFRLGATIFRRLTIMPGQFLPIRRLR